ncbi:MAG: hypothetical protein K1Y36_27810 [Blastocatellia bacterium]|nr:hypothetical protein [Blastocatellia bacterium]
MDRLSLPEDVLQQVKELIRRGKPIQAIALVRNQTEYGLKEAGAIVQALEKELAQDSPNWTGNQTRFDV